MKQDRMKGQSDRSRTDIEPAEGSREDVRGGDSSSERGLDEGSGMRGGTSKDRSDISSRDLEDLEEFEQDQGSER